MVIVLVLQERILTVHRQRILCKIIRSDAQKIYSDCKFTADHNCCRCLDHDSCHDILKWNIFLAQAFLHFPDNLLNLIHFFFGIDHWKHHREIAVSTGTIDCAKLCLKHSSSIQTETDSAVTHDRIGLLRDVQIRCLLICAKICSTNHSQSFSHRLSHFLIRTEQLVFSRIILTTEVLEFTSKKSDTLRTVIKYAAQVTHVADICIKSNLSSIFCLILLGF